MLLKCDLVILNRAAPPGTEHRKCHATFVLGKQKKKKNLEGEEVFFILFTSKNKVGIKYKVVENILKVHNRFVKEGKCTISMKNPSQDLAISKADVNTLKKFLHVLRQALTKKDISDIGELENVLKIRNCDIEKPKTRLSVFSRATYPVKAGFPVTLENLTVNDCCLQKFDTCILKLRFLTILDLSRNKLQSLCESLDSLENLRCLHLSQNAFESVPLCVTNGETAKRLRQLDLSSNHINHLPARIASLKELHTLKVNANSLVSIPHTFGQLQELRRLEMNNNKLTCLPWSFTKLNLDLLDASGNRFHEMKIGLLEDVMYDLPHPPSLLETCCRAVIRNRIRKAEQTMLPRRIREVLAIARYCPCGEPTAMEGLPFVSTFDAAMIAHTLSYNLDNKEPLKIMTSLCSLRCYQLYIADPLAFHRKCSRR